VEQVVGVFILGGINVERGRFISRRRDMRKLLPKVFFISEGRFRKVLRNACH
jgi:hypothetical protein